MDNIDRKYKLPPPLPTIQNGKPQPIYPLMLEHKGDNNQLFAGKYVGEIEHIYDLFYKLITCQSIDENNPLEHEAKIHNNNFYIYQNGKWVLIGDIRKPYFGAIDYMENKFEEQIFNMNFIKNDFKEFAGSTQQNIENIKVSVEEAKDIVVKKAEQAKNYAQEAEISNQEAFNTATKLNYLINGLDLSNIIKVLSNFRCIEDYLIVPLPNIVIGDKLYIENTVYDSIINNNTNTLTIRLKAV